MVFNAFLRFRLRSKSDDAVLSRSSKEQQQQQHHHHRHHHHHHHLSGSAGTKLRHQAKQTSDAKKTALLTISDIPAWRDPNPFILTGYRSQSHSVAGSFASWLYWHNESCNIYSHLLPGLFLLLGQGALYDHVRARHWDLDPFDASILTLQVLTAVLCFLTSATYHTLVDHSAEIYRRWLQLDYVGIMTLIMGNFISGLHFGFYCDPHMKYFYWSLIIVLGCTTCTLLLIPKFRGPEWRSFRLGSMIGTGLSAFAPVGHATMLWGVSYAANIGVPYYLLEGLFLVVGCFFWERRFPERLSPGKFDLFGHSHTIWHVCVTLSVGAHICGLVSALDFAYDHQWCRKRA